MKRTGILGGLFATSLLLPAGLLPVKSNDAVARKLGHVRGVVFDSLSMQALPNALVWMPGSTHSVIADKDGRFDIDEVPTGPQVIAFSTPALDSLGLGTLGGRFDVRADGVSQIALATPSFRSVWGALCKDIVPIGSDSGIAWGTVRDAANDIRLSNAVTRFNWLDLHVIDKTVSVDEISRDVRSDSTGSYYACGLPVDFNILTEAEGSHAASGIVQYNISYRRVLRVDLLVSKDMIHQGSDSQSVAEAQLSKAKLRGTSVIHGTVRDDHGNTRAGVQVKFASIDSTIKTDVRGEFTFSGLPAGSQLIETRTIGLDLTRTIVDLRDNARTDVDVVMQGAYALEAMTIRADPSADRYRLDFEKRKKGGWGTVVEAKDFENAPDITAVLRRLPFLSVGKYRGETILQFPSVRLHGDGTCSPIIWLDGRRSDIGEVSAIDVSYLVAVESYPRGAEAPPEFVGLSQGCGVVLFWSKRTKW